MPRPYSETYVGKNSFVRSFSPEGLEEELSWHMDKKDRTIKVLSGSSWMYQEDNRLPVKIFPGDVFSIKKETWHRVIRGSDTLEVYIEEAQ